MTTPRGIARVHVDTWRATYRGIVPEGHLDSMSYERAGHGWLERLRRQTDKERIFVAEDPDVIIGFASCGKERTGDPAFHGEVYAIYVLPESQGLGAGRALMLSAAKFLNKAGFGSALVWVLRDNPSRAFYKRLEGERLREQEIEIGGKILVEVAYGWRNIKTLIEACGPLEA